MTNSKTTKRALLSSVVALLLCFTMLLGTTFAWFTDSVSNGVNKIQAGNLDVVLEHKRFDSADYMSMTEYEEVGATTPLFLNIDGDPVLWEPGACADEYFKITNNGRLALKYQFKLAFANASETPEGNTLADVLSIYAVYHNYYDAENNSIEASDPALSGMKDSPFSGYNQVALQDFVLESYLLPGESIEFQIGVEWKHSKKDNEFNVPGGLSIDLGATLLATQFTYEKDSTGDQYDKDAEYPEIALPPITTAEGLQEALNQGGEFVLGADIEFEEELVIPEGVNVTIDLAGNDMISNNSGEKNALMVEGNVTILNTSSEKAAVKVEGNQSSSLVPAIGVSSTGVLNFEDGDIDITGDTLSAGIIVEGGELNFNNGTITVGGNGASYGIMATYDAVINVNGGEIIVDAPNAREAYGIMGMWGSDDKPVTVNLNNGKITVVNAGTFQYAVAVLDGTLELNIADGFVINVAPGANYYGEPAGVGTLIVNGKEPLLTATELSDALANAGAGDTIELATGVNYGTIEITNTLENVVFEAGEDANALFTVKSGAVLENVTFKGLDLSEYNGTTGSYSGAINIEEGAQADITFEECAFAPNAGYSAVRSYEASAEVEFVKCTFVGGRYAFYKSGEPIESLVFDNCDFVGQSSWIAQTHGGSNPITLSVTNCTFDSCTGGLFKCGSAYPAGSVFKFENNIITNSTGHDGSSAKWFELNVSNATVSISGNTLDGVEWNPDSTCGLTK